MNHSGTENSKAHCEKKFKLAQEYNFLKLSFSTKLLILKLTLSITDGELRDTFLKRGSDEPNLVEQKQQKTFDKTDNIEHNTASSRI